MRGFGGGVGKRSTIIWRGWGGGGGRLFSIIWGLIKCKEKKGWDIKICFFVYCSGAGGVGGRSRIVNGGGVRASGFRSRIRSG